MTSFSLLEMEVRKICWCFEVSKITSSSFSWLWVSGFGGEEEKLTWGYDIESLSSLSLLSCWVLSQFTRISPSHCNKKQKHLFKLIIITQKSKIIYLPSCRSCVKHKRSYLARCPGRSFIQRMPMATTTVISLISSIFNMWKKTLWKITSVVFYATTKKRKSYRFGTIRGRVMTE